MRLAELAKVPGASLEGDGTIEVTGVQYDSRRVKPGDLFVADISEVVATRLNPQATLLVIESWTPQRGLRIVERQ